MITLSETDTDRDYLISLNVEIVNVSEMKLSLEHMRGPGFDTNTTNTKTNTQILWPQLPCVSSPWLCQVSPPDLRIHGMETDPHPSGKGSWKKKL